MMNIYKYIRSKDVREYNDKIGHKFTAMESAFLVWLNYEITLKEKHDAWREIMREMPDEEVSKRCNTDYAPSLFALLNKFINDDNRLIDEFYKKTNERFIHIGIFAKAILRSAKTSGRYIPIWGIFKGSCGKIPILTSYALNIRRNISRLITEK